jgi:hypothetical protein
LLIGIDFDNTIAGYDHVFPVVAESEGLLARGAATSKAEVRSLLRAEADGETKWMALQGRVYGAHMHHARMIEGVGEFLTRCRIASIAIRIVSHKTETGHFDPDRVNLREAAMAWMAGKGFFAADGFGLVRGDVHFEATREDKVARIAALGCTHFIDDLEEVFLEPGFPAGVEGFLLAANRMPPPQGPFRAMADWKSIADCILPAGR